MAPRTALLSEVMTDSSLCSVPLWLFLSSCQLISHCFPFKHIGKVSTPHAIKVCGVYIDSDEVGGFFPFRQFKADIFPLSQPFVQGTSQIIGNQKAVNTEVSA